MSRQLPVEATHLVISIEGALAIAVAIVGGAFGIYRASANAHAEIRAILATHAEKFNTINERFNTIEERFNTVDERFNSMNERFNAVDGRFNAVDDRFNTLGTQIKSIDDKVDKLGSS